MSSLIATLNDRFRETFVGGDVVLTRGIVGLDDQLRSDVLRSVQRFDTFTHDNDPHGEHDFGSIDLPDIERVFWKIDYYDTKLEYRSDDPSDPALTRRVLTIMLASEY